MLEAHGLFTWADTSKACYENTLDIINRATTWLAEKSRGKRPFGAVTTQALTIDRRREIAAGIMPTIRGFISGADAGTFKVGHFDDSEAVLDFVGGEKLAALAALGTSCPDHFLRTKIWPLVLPFDPARDSVERPGSAREAGDRVLSRALRRLLRALQARRIRRRCAIRIRWCIWCPAWA